MSVAVNHWKNRTRRPRENGKPSPKAPALVFDGLRTMVRHYRRYLQRTPLLCWW
jgi:hypothetical protein